MMYQYRKTPRAYFLDYDAGDYFITLCTKNTRHYFGEIIGERMILSEIGLFVQNQLTNVESICDYVKIPLFTVMPNHIHAIVRVDSNVDNIPPNQRCVNPSLRANSTCQRHVPTLSRYINSLKGTVTKYSKSIGIEFAWLGRYNDHQIRNIHDGNNIAKYIENNVAKWAADCYNTM